MNRILQSLVIPVLLLAVVACRPDPVPGDDPKVQKSIDCTIERTLPEGLSDLTITEETLTIHDRTSGADKEYKSLEGIKLTPGLYDLNYTAECQYKLQGNAMQGRLVAQLSNLQITDKTASPLNVSLELRIVPTVRDFVIQEIFFTGTQTPAGRPYVGTNYVVLYNGTDQILYADGIAFCESEFNPAFKFDYKPDLRQTDFIPHAVYVVPGSGKEHPVKPGERFILCDIGIDHKAQNPNAFDLSKADFEWYDESSVPNHTDFDSPLVPNLDKWYCYTRSFFILHNRGLASYVIARMPIAKEQWLQEYVYDYSYIFPATGAEVNKSSYRIPLEWVIDGVNCSVESEHKWTVLPETVDAGYTHCGTINSQKDRFFHSIRRKYLGKDATGNMILQDTNDSSRDFNPMATPSLVEEQGAAIDAQGTPCMTKTYDGVVPIQ